LRDEEEEGEDPLIIKRKRKAAKGIISEGGNDADGCVEQEDPEARAKHAKKEKGIFLLLFLFVITTLAN
jgi:hypothetical protein